MWAAITYSGVGRMRDCFGLVPDRYDRRLHLSG